MLHSRGVNLAKIDICRDDWWQRVGIILESLVERLVDFAEKEVAFKELNLTLVEIEANIAPLKRISSA